MTEEKEKHLTQLIEAFNEDILRVLELDGLAFYNRPVWRREKYVTVTREFTERLKAELADVKADENHQSGQGKGTK